MGLFSSIFGKKPKAPTRQGYTAADQQMLGQASALQADAQRYLPFQNTRLAEVADPNAGRDAAARVGSVSAAQAVGAAPTQATYDAGDVRGSGALLQRVRAVSRAASMGDEQARMQGLRDRVAMVKYGKGLRSGAYSAIASSAGNSGAMQSIANQATLTPDYMQPYKSNFLGTVIGSAYGAWENNRAPSLVTPVNGTGSDLYARNAALLASDSPAHYSFN